MMCVSAGKSEGEIAWRRCEGIGSRGHVVGWLERRSLDTSASVRRQKAKRRVLAIFLVKRGVLTYILAVFKYGLAIC